MVERVICVPRSIVGFTGCVHWSDDWAENASDRMAFMPRDKSDPDGIESPNGLGRDWLQVVAYAVLEHRGDVYCYRRREGSDRRLEGRLSVGFGGHVNLIDFGEYEGNVNPIWGSIIDAADREIDEEVDLFADDAGLPVLADYHIDSLIYDPSDDIGRVHLGALVRVVLPDEFRRGTLKILDESCSPIGWIDPTGVPPNWQYFESWSRLVLDHLSADKS